MKFFESPRATKPVGPVIKSLLVRCPVTSKLTATGQTIDESLWEKAKVKDQKYTCPYCGGVHRWSKKDVVLGRLTK